MKHIITATTHKVEHVRAVKRGQTNEARWQAHQRAPGPPYDLDGTSDVGYIVRCIASTYLLPLP